MSEYEKLCFFFLVLYFGCVLGETQLISLQIELCHNWEGWANVFIAKFAFSPAPLPIRTPVLGWEVWVYLVGSMTWWLCGHPAWRQGLDKLTFGISSVSFRCFCYLNGVVSGALLAHWEPPPCLHSYHACLRLCQIWFVLTGVFVSYRFVPSKGGLWHCVLNIPPSGLCTLIACPSAKAKLACMTDSWCARLGDPALQLTSDHIPGSQCQHSLPDTTAPSLKFPDQAAREGSDSKSVGRMSVFHSARGSFEVPLKQIQSFCGL